ncbi:hypothetical protein Acr_01g0001770 [Actinidia rufa]|uniref:Transmembrane protein n=1 Tax=Actinidia rufa TaxID=165716 RepID=A0A7J0E1T6_9ERIC|nr:hypothetical protein Acr_01g0001770 [Actinidia rufa]
MRMQKFTENEATDSAKDATSMVSIPSPGEEEHVNGTCNGEHGVNHLANGLTSQNGSALQNCLMKSVASNCEEGGELEDFLDPQDSISAKSNTEGESNKLSFESGPQPSPRDVEAELHPIASDEDEEGADPAEELCRQVYLARFVSNSIGRGTARAEVEMEMEAQVESKNFEIARLWDRLHYYEAVNREMSQRNQEAVETSRRLRQRRKRWVWGSIAAAITLATGALAWSYFSTGGQSSSTGKTVAPEHGSRSRVMSSLIKSVVSNHCPGGFAPPNNASGDNDLQPAWLLMNFHASFP